jgi:hypothetical protein
MKLERWTDRPLTYEPTGNEDHAALLLRRSVVSEPLDTAALADIRSRLPDGRKPAQRRLVLRLVLALALFLSGGGAVMSASLLQSWGPFRRPPVTARPISPPATPRRTVSAPAASEVVAPLSPDMEPTPTSVPARGEPPRRALPPRAPALEPPAAAEPAPFPVVSSPVPSAIAEEAQLVGEALRRLRERGDAAGALALLDERDRRFRDGGALGEEVRTTRVEALLRLGEQDHALALLDGSAPRPSGRGRALLVTRGELRAEAGRCPEAISDFDALLAGKNASDDAAERALYGRAACRARAGESDAARADLEAYLERFPAGRHAAPARAALDR